MLQELVWKGFEKEMRLEVIRSCRSRAPEQRVLIS